MLNVNISTIIWLQLTVLTFINYKEINVIIDI